MRVKKQTNKHKRKHNIKPLIAYNKRTRRRREADTQIDKKIKNVQNVK